MLALFFCAPSSSALAEGSVARRWNDALLNAIRVDYPAPTVHARNLFHLSAAMFDAWAAYDPAVPGYFVNDDATADDIAAARDKAVSYAAFRILSARFVEPKSSPFAEEYANTSFPALMVELGYDPAFSATSGQADPPAELGNFIASVVLRFGDLDGANEAEGYVDDSYAPINPPMLVDLPGVLQPPRVGQPTPELPDPNYWQPLSLKYRITQNGIVLGQDTQVFLGSHWGDVVPFALERDDPSEVYNDPGPPPKLGCEGGIPCPSDTQFKDAVVRVIRFSSRLDPDDGASLDISPGGLGANSLGANDGRGYAENPRTEEPYAPNMVKRGDYGRILAEFWADGPESETPPGHWNTLANYVSDHPMVMKRFAGTGPVLEDLEWDVKLYFVLNGALHDAAIAAWDAKRKYDYVRPITAIRYMGGKGQCSDPQDPSYHPEGLPLVDDLIEVVTTESSAAGERHEFVLNDQTGLPAVGEIAIYSWPGQPEDTENEYSGARWIRAVEWLPYQRETFVTPPFAGYISGHSAFSRAGAEVLTRFTGDDYFPGGLGTFTAEQDHFLEFESGPSEEIQLQWARYYDASDQAGASRLWGGIHVDVDDLNGRRVGSQIGLQAYELASIYFVPEPRIALFQAAALASLALLSRRARR